MAEMRRKDRQLPAAEARAILEAGEYGVLATADEAGNPYAVPVNYALEGDTIYFHGALDGEKTKHLLHRPAVCFTVVGRTAVQPERFGTRYESAVAFGTARRVTDSGEKAHGLRLLIEKYSAAYQEEGEAYIRRSADATAVWAISVGRLTGKACR